MAIRLSALLEKLLKDDLKLGIKSVFTHPAVGFPIIVVSMEQQYPGHAKRIAHAIWASQVGVQYQHVLVVGEDIDPTNLGEVLWAFATRCKPDRDIAVISNEGGHGLWPCLSPAEREGKIGPRVLFEATFPPDWPKDWRPQVVDWTDWSEDLRRATEKRWLDLKAPG